MTIIGERSAIKKRNSLIICIDIVVTSTNCTPGLRVRRGMDWKWGDIGFQEFTDSSTTSGIKRTPVLGTVVQLRDDDWARVMWDNGYSNIYRIGGGKSFDLYKNNQSKNTNFIIFFNIAFNSNIKTNKSKTELTTLQKCFSSFYRLTKRTGSSKTTYRSNGYRTSVLHQPCRNKPERWKP